MKGDIRNHFQFLCILGVVVDCLQFIPFGKFFGLLSLHTVYIGFLEKYQTYMFDEL